MRAVVAIASSLCAIAAITAHELSSQTLAEARARFISGPPADLASPILAEAPPTAPEDIDPTGPAKLRPAHPTRSDTRVERRAPPRASPPRPQEK